MSDSGFRVPAELDRYIAALSRLCGVRGAVGLQRVLVNARIEVEAGVTHDNWNGGVDGHALLLTLPEGIYAESFDELDAISDAIKKDLNRLIERDDEFIESVRILPPPVHDKDWRAQSGLIETTRRAVAPEAEGRVWRPAGRFRVFLSHKADVRAEVGRLKDQLVGYGAACFVAHDDVKPTQEWLNEIENALFSADALVAVMTEAFHDSDWTDQEIGIAFGRGIPVLALRLGRDPYGFIGRFQALTASWDSAAFEIAKVLISHEAMQASYASAVEQCRGWDAANRLASVLPALDKPTKGMVDRLLVAYERNAEVRDAFGFNGKSPRSYGRGLRYHLARATGQQFSLDPNGVIVRA